MSQVDLNTILARIEILRRHAATLDILIANTEAVVQSVDTALGSIEALKAGGTMLVPGDPGFILLYKAKPVDVDKVLVHIGGGVYAALPIDKAREKLEDMLVRVGKTLSDLRKEREATLRELADLERIVQLAVAQAQAQASQASRAPKRKS